MKVKNLAVLLLLFTFFPLKDNVEVINTQRVVYEKGVANNYLSQVSFEGVDFNFNKELTEYTFHVPFSKKTLGLEYELENKNCIVDIIGDEELLVGNNSLAIIVTDENGEVREYDFTIIRANDSSNVENDENSIESALNHGEASSLNVDVIGNAAILNENTIDALRNSKKNLIYEWKDQNGKFAASLKIDGKFLKDEKNINPNIKRNITTAKLIKYLNGIEYIGISTDNTNIPEGSIYKLAIAGTEDIYDLYYIENGRIQNRILRNIDGAVEFEIKDGVDYAIVARSLSPKEEIKGFSWFWPSLFVTLLFLLFLAGYKYINMKMIRKSRNSYEDKKDELDSEIIIKVDRKEEKIPKKENTKTNNSQKKKINKK